MKSELFIGEAKSLDKNELLESFAISIPIKSVMNDKPKTAIPGAIEFTA